MEMMIGFEGGEDEGEVEDVDGGEDDGEDGEWSVDGGLVAAVDGDSDGVG